jgi:hypothetical protein
VSLSISQISGISEKQQCYQQTFKYRHHQTSSLQQDRDLSPMPKSFHSSRKRYPSSAPSTPSSNQPNQLSNKDRGTIIKSFNSTTTAATSAPLTTQTPSKTSSSSNQLSIKDRGTTINQTSVDEHCSLERTIDIKIIRAPNKGSRTKINQTQVNENCSFKRTIHIESSLHHGSKCNKQIPPKSSSLHKGSRTGETRRNERVKREMNELRKEGYDIRIFACMT